MSRTSPRHSPRARRRETGNGRDGHQPGPGDVANELVDWFNAVDLAYRSDLRELNELNFARFDAKLEQRIAELRAELRTEIHHVRTEIQQVRTDLLRWMFGFWVTTLMALAEILLALGR